MNLRNFLVLQLINKLLFMYRDTSFTMSNIYEDYTDGNKKQVKILPLNELALSALLRSNLIARIKG